MKRVKKTRAAQLLEIRAKRALIPTCRLAAFDEATASASSLSWRVIYVRSTIQQTKEANDSLCCWQTNCCLFHPHVISIFQKSRAMDATRCSD